MKQPSVAEKLESLEAPKPRAEARLAARNAALNEFARVQAVLQEQPTPEQAARQGFWSRLRLSRNDTRDGSSSMKWGLVSRSALSAVASGCIATFAIAVLWPMFRDQSTPSVLPERYEPQADLRRPARKNDAPKPAVPPPPQPTSQSASRVEQVKQAQGRLRQHAGGAQSRPPVVEPIDVPLPEPEMAAPQMTIVTSNAPPPPPPGLAAIPAQAPAESSANGDPGYSEELNEVVVTGARRLSGSSREMRREAKAQRQQKAARVTNNVFVAPPKEGAYFHAEGDDKFEHFDLNPIKRVAEEPVSTFSADVDTASYSFARRTINEGRLPPKDSVRVEEMINYFDYAWPKPESRKTPFAATISVGDSPWTKGKKLVHVGIKGYDVDRNEVPDANLVFLMDVSGSMESPDKLPLAVQSMKLLLQRLKPTDTVGIVVYAGAAGTVLEPTAVKDEGRILKALDSLQAGGSTAGAEGIELAYQLAEKSFRKGGVNRVMLATDGDFNVGINDAQALKSFIERKREKGIFLSVLGFGEGNYRDELAQALAQNGNGVAAYIDTIAEAKKVLVEQSTGSLFTIAKDVKLQVEFNPQTVAEYRLVGYETRALRREDFNNDKIDAGDIGAGHTVTALYEITPVGSPALSVDALRYQSEGKGAKTDKAGSLNEYGFLKIRYKLPDEDTSKLISQVIPLDTPDMSGVFADVIRREANFSTAVAGFAQLLKGGQFTGKLTYEDVIEQARAARGEDRNGHRAEFIELVRKASKARGM